MDQNPYENEKTIWRSEDGIYELNLSEYRLASGGRQENVGLSQSLVQALDRAFQEVKDSDRSS